MSYTQFHDYKKSGIDADRLRVREAEWAGKPCSDRGMMWRRVPDEVKSAIDRESALRPLLDTGTARYPGFKPERCEEIFK